MRARGNNVDRSGGLPERETVEKSGERMVGCWREDGGAVGGRRCGGPEAAAMT